MFSDIAHRKIGLKTDCKEFVVQLLMAHCVFGCTLVLIFRMGYSDQQSNNRRRVFDDYRQIRRIFTFYNVGYQAPRWVRLSEFPYRYDQGSAFEKHGRTTI